MFTFVTCRSCEAHADTRSADERASALIQKTTGLPDQKTVTSADGNDPDRLRYPSLGGRRLRACYG